MVLIDELRHPFSLFAEVKKSNSGAKVDRAGGVEETMDRSIGRSVIALKGTVSANNYIDYQELQLTGGFIYIQFSLLKLNVGTIHLEIVTNDDLPFRISCSTLHKEPRFLARQLRLPIPVVDIKQGSYLLMKLHIDAILAKFCSVPSSGSGSGSTKHLSMKHIKRMQLCSSMLVRDVITSDQSLGTEYKALPKDLQLKPLAEANMYLYDVLEQNAAATPSPSRGRSIPVSPSRQPNGTANNGGLRASDLILIYCKAGKGNSSANTSVMSATAILNNSHASVQHTAGASHGGSGVPKSPENTSDYVTAGIADVELNSIVYSETPGGGGGAGTEYGCFSGAVSGATEVGFGASDNTHASSNSLVSTRIRKEKTYKLPSQQPTASAYAMALAAAQQNASAGLVPTLDRCVGYDGVSSILLLYSGHLAVFPSGNMLVLVDLTGVTSHSRGFDSDKGGVGGGSQLKGLWKLFPSDREKSPVAEDDDDEEEEGNDGDDCEADGGGGILIDKDTGYKQAYLYGHTSPVTILEVSYAANVLLSAEGGVPNGQLIVWDLNDVNIGSPAPVSGVHPSPGSGSGIATPTSGIKLACFRPHFGSIVCCAVSADGTMLVTVGFDQFRRYQIIVWDLQVLILERVGLNCSVGGHGTTGGTPSKRGTAAAGAGSSGSATPLSPHAAVRAKAGVSAPTAVTVGSGLDNVNGLIIAKQISDFPITKIKFSPFETYALVSCGRENIRFWRIRKGHLPGRPVALNQFSRKGFCFSDLECVSCPAYTSGSTSATGGPTGGDKAAAALAAGTGAEDDDMHLGADETMNQIKPAKTTTLTTKYSGSSGIGLANSAKKRISSSKGTKSAPVDVMKSTVFVISDKGLLFRIDYESEKIVSSYHLHTGAITSMALLHCSAADIYGQTIAGATAGSTPQAYTSASANAAGTTPSCYIVTGGSDQMMRVWPMDFTDYILESQHEGAVNSLQTMTVTTTTPTSVSNYGYEPTNYGAVENGEEYGTVAPSYSRPFSSSYQILVGTSAVTIGLLDMSMHSYHTVVRSHDGPVHYIASNSAFPCESTCKALHGEEFVTLGSSDHTIRLFDSVSTQQKYEFTAPVDVATVAVFHPKDHLLVCGFESGYVRVFEIENTLTLYEKNRHIGAVTSLVFDSAGDKLYSAGVDGQVYMYEVELGYDARHVASVAGPSAGRASSAPSTPSKTADAGAAVYLSLSQDGLLLAACSNRALNTLVVVDTCDYSVQFKLSDLQVVQPAARFDTSMRTTGVFTPSPSASGTASGIGNSGTGTPTGAASNSSVTKAEQTLLNSPVNGLVFVTDATYHADNSTIYYESIPSSSSALYVATDKSIVGFVVDSVAVTRICKEFTYGKGNVEVEVEDENVQQNPFAQSQSSASNGGDNELREPSISSGDRVMNWEDRLVKKLIQSAAINPNKAAKAYLLHPNMRIKSIAHDPNHPNIFTFTCRANSDTTVPATANTSSGSAVATKYRNYGSGVAAGSPGTGAAAGSGAGVMTPSELNTTQYADSFFLLAFKLKVHHNTATDSLQNKLFFSQPVVHTLPMGGYITSLATCFSEGKLLCTDSCGIVSVWHWEQVHMDELIVCVDYPPVPPMPEGGSFDGSGSSVGLGLGLISSPDSDGMGTPGAVTPTAASHSTAGDNNGVDSESEDEFCTDGLIHGAHGDTHAAAHLGIGIADQVTFTNTEVNARTALEASPPKNQFGGSDFRSKSIDNSRSSNNQHAMHVDFDVSDNKLTTNATGGIPQHLRPAILSVDQTVGPTDLSASSPGEISPEMTSACMAPGIDTGESPCDYSSALFSPTVYDTSGYPVESTITSISATERLAASKAAQAETVAAVKSGANAPTPRTKVRMQNTLHKSSSWFSSGPSSVVSPRQPKLSSSLHRRPSVPTISNTGNARSPRTPRSNATTPRARGQSGMSPIKAGSAKGRAGTDSKSGETGVGVVSVTSADSAGDAPSVETEGVDFSSMYGDTVEPEPEPEPKPVDESQPYIIGGDDSPDEQSDSESEYYSSDESADNPYHFKPPIPSEVQISQELSWRCQHISHRVSVRPSYSAKLQEFVACDGASIVVRQLSRRIEGPLERPGGDGCGSSFTSSSTTSVLTKPHDFTAVGGSHWQGVVLSAEHSNYGDYISVVVLKDAGGDVVNDSSNNNNNVCELLLWRLATDALMDQERERFACSNEFSTAAAFDTSDVHDVVATARGAEFAELHQRIYFTSVYLPTATLITTWTRLYTPSVAAELSAPGPAVNNDLNDDLLLVCLPGGNAQEVSISLVSMNMLLLLQQRRSAQESSFAVGADSDDQGGVGVGVVEQGRSMSSLILESSVPVVLFPATGVERRSTVKVHSDTTILGMKTVPTWARGSTTTFAGKTDDIGVLLWSNTKIWVVNLTAITKAQATEIISDSAQAGSSALCAVLNWTLDLKTNCKVKSIDVCGYDNNSMGGASFSLAVMLDTFDNLYVVAVTHGADCADNVVRSTTVPISGAHASGSPRSVVCTTKSNSPYLIVNYAKSFTVFKLNVAIDGSSVFASLKYIQKVCLTYCPEHLTILPVQPSTAAGNDEPRDKSKNMKKPHERSNSINDLLVSNGDGELSLVSFFSNTQGTNNALEVAQHSVSTIVSALPTRFPVQMLTHSEHTHPTAGYMPPIVAGAGRVRDSNLLSMLDRKGNINLYHSNYGVKLPAPGDGDPIGLQTVQCISTYYNNSAGNGNGSAATRSPSYMAAGLKCGRILIYNSSTMALLKVLPVPVKFSIKPHTFIEAQEWIDDLLYHSFTPHSGTEALSEDKPAAAVTSKTKTKTKTKSIDTTGCGRMNGSTSGLNYKSHNRKYYEGLIDSQNKVGMVKHVQIISSPINSTDSGNDPINESSSSASSSGTTNNGSVLALAAVYEDNTIMIYDISNVSCTSSNDNNVMIWRSDSNAKPFLPSLGGNKHEIVRLTEDSFSIAKINSSRSRNGYSCITGFLRCHDVCEGGSNSALFGVMRSESPGPAPGATENVPNRVIDLVEVKRIPIAVTTANLQFGAAMKFSVSLLNSDIRFTANANVPHTPGIGASGAPSTPSMGDVDNSDTPGAPVYNHISPTHHHVVRYGPDVVAIYMLCELVSLIPTGSECHSPGTYSPGGSPGIVSISDGFGENDKRSQSEHWIMCGLISPVAAANSGPYYVEKLLNLSSVGNEAAATGHAVPVPVVDVCWDYLCGSVLTTEQLIVLDIRETIGYVSTWMTNKALGRVSGNGSVHAAVLSLSTDGECDSDGSNKTPLMLAVNTLYIDLNYSFNSVNSCDWNQSKLLCQQLCYDRNAADEEVIDKLTCCQEEEIDAFIVKEEANYANRAVDVVLDGGTVIKHSYNSLTFTPKSYKVCNNNLCMQICVYRHHQSTLMKFDIEDAKTYQCVATTVEA